MSLAIFDLDHTLLSGDSDMLWCEYLVEHGWLTIDGLERASAMAAQYVAGTVQPEAYCQLHASTVIGRTPAELLPMRQRFVERWILPRLGDEAHALLERHRSAGDTLLLTTATSRVVSGLTAQALGFTHYLCTELELSDGRYNGRISGTLNMRTGKLEKLRAWLAEQQLPESLLKRATFYSDSINDLALLSVVGRPVVVNPDARLESTAIRKGWTVLRLDRRRQPGSRSPGRDDE